MRLSVQQGQRLLSGGLGFRVSVWSLGFLPGREGSIGWSSPYGLGAFLADDDSCR